MAKIITVCGSPNSGKTTIATAMGITLSRKGFNTCVIYCDDIVPTLPVLLPQSTLKIGDLKQRSIGKILSLADFSTNDILSNMIYLKQFNRLSLLGYAYGENTNTYHQFTNFDIYNFYSKMSEMVDFIVVDGSNNPNNGLTTVSLENSDVVLRVGGSSYSDISYFASNLKELNINEENELVIFGKQDVKDAFSELSEFYGGHIDFTIKKNPKIEEMMKYGEYFMGKFPPSYIKSIEEIINRFNFMM